jgi:adenine-specific DNA methylase
MIPKECKRLAEVDFPIAVVSAHAAREKSIHHRHPSTLHLWWARRPLASCRAVLMALLLPDPCDEHCPADFKAKAREAFRNVAGLASVGPSDLELRRALLKFIGDFADWNLAADRVYLDAARRLVKAAHTEETPLVVDPFAGGGSIPLEALRLGCDAFASDLNPVACLINKVLLEDIPRHGPELAEELRRVGVEIKKAAERELAEFYPADPDGARPIAYLWARTVRCEAPNCGAEIPLVRSFWLCKKADRRRASRTKVVRPTKGVPHVEFEIFEPASEEDVRDGTVSRAKATCVCCGTVLAPDRVRTQIAAQRGGADVVFDAKGKRTGGVTLLAVVTLREGQPGRHYRLPKRPDGLNAIPDEPLPPIGTLGFRVQRYGMLRWGDLFTERQKLGLLTYGRQIARLSEEASREAMALALSKLTELACSLCAYEPVAECPRHLFGRQALPVTWDFGEGVLSSDSSGSFEVSQANIEGGLESVGQMLQGAKPQLADACDSPLPDETAAAWFTDPPYYDAIPYSDLSDFFLVWLKRTLPGHPLLRDPFDPTNPLSPKMQEAVQDETKKVNGRPKDRAFFEVAMAKAFAEGRRVLREDGVGSLVFAHKTTEGWEALLSGMIRGGWTITGSWPLSTEMASRLRARDSAALATSVHLVCRPRSADAPVGDWAHVLRELPRRVREWMDRLQAEGVRGADLVFACIGPALEIYSRYSKVVDAEEREIPLGGDPVAPEAHRRGYLAYVWEVVGRLALEQVLGTAESRGGDGAGALEEDARLTALFLWTLQTTAAAGVSDAPSSEEDEEADEEDEDEAPAGKKKKGLALPFDVARRFAQPLGIHLDAWEGRCITTEKGVVRLVPLLERARQLFGNDGAEGVADRLEKTSTAPIQKMLFPEMAESPAPAVRGRKRQAGGNVSDESLRPQRGATTLDRVHAAMLLQSSGRANALRALLTSEVQRGPEFLRLANALSALYPPGSDEKRLLDAMLLAVPR